MTDKGKQNIFTGPELQKLNNFCKDCAEEDRRIHEQRKYNSYENNEYSEPQEPEPPKPQPQTYNPPSNNYSYNEYQDNSNCHCHHTYKDSVKTNVIGENDPDPHNARIKIDTFNQRLQQFGGNK